MVHVWQWNAEHACNGGLIEGIADWVRLHADLAPPHWKRRCTGCKWDSGYDVTAYFLEWMEERAGQGTVVKMNQDLRGKYTEEKFWSEYGDGEDVNTLWSKYTQSLREDPCDTPPPEKSKPAVQDGGEASDDKKDSVLNGVA